MSFTEKKYKIIGHCGEIYSLTAKQLYERILKDSRKSDFNWIAPANELLRTCKKRGFPAEYANSIKCAILNCYANIEHRANCGGDRYVARATIQEAIQECYNSLYVVETEEVVLARKRYLNAMITTASYTYFLDSFYHPDPTFQKLRKNWEKTKVEEYISKKQIDFKKLEKSLHNEFVEMINKAKAEGAFEEDEKANREYWIKFWRKMRV